MFCSLDPYCTVQLLRPAPLHVLWGGEGGIRFRRDRVRPVENVDRIGCAVLHYRERDEYRSKPESLTGSAGLVAEAWPGRDRTTVIVRRRCEQYLVANEIDDFFNVEMRAARLTLMMMRTMATLLSRLIRLADSTYYSTTQMMNIRCSTSAVQCRCTTVCSDK